MLRSLLISALVLGIAFGSGAQAPGSTSLIAGGERAFTGEPISITAKNADLQDVLRLISKTAGLNLILDDDLKGKTVTLDLHDVPWDQALDLVLRGQGLGADWTGNVLRIATYELLHEADVPVKVIVDEAVEVARRFGSEKSSAFVNGVADTIAKAARP